MVLSEATPWRALRQLPPLYEITFADLDFRAVWRILGDVRCNITI